MCSALEELKREGILEGIEKGKQEGIQEGIRAGIEKGKIEGIVKTYKEFGASQDAAVQKLKSECGLTEERAWASVKEYWLS